MKGIQKRLGSLLMAAVMLLSLAVTPAMAAGEKEPPTEVTASSNFGYDFRLTFSNGAEWLSAITKIEVDGTAWNKVSSSYSVWNDKDYYVDAENGYLYIGEDFSANPATCVISATGYNDLTLKLNKTNHTAEVVENSGSNSGSSGGSGSTEKPDTPEKGTIDLSKVSFAKSFDGNDWQVTFGEDGYAEKITAVTVNGKPWNATSFLAYGGQYKISDGKLLFARNSYSGTAALKSGDVITITADGYKDLTFKLVINTDGSASVEENDGKGDPLELHVKIEGSFEAAIVGQKNYDGVSSASVGGASSNKNSAVTVYGALVEKGTDPTDKDWEKLNNESEIRLVGSKCSVSIVPDILQGYDRNRGQRHEGCLHDPQQ